MTRSRKVIVVGSTDFSFVDERFSVTSVNWETASRGPNLRDFDVVIFNLLSDHAIQWSDDDFKRRLKVSVLHDILDHDGDVIVLGDPRVSMSYGNEPYFQDWLGLTFKWIPGGGDTVVFQPKAAEYQRFAPYLAHLKKWNYSLAGVELMKTPWLVLIGAEWFGDKPQRVQLRSSVLARNRYGASIASVHRFVYEKSRPYPQQHWERLRLSGSIAFLPKVQLSELDSIALILQESVGIPIKAPEPAWVHGVLPPEALAKADAQLTTIRKQQSELQKLEEVVVESRSRAAAPVSLLYQTGAALEEAVWDALEVLGAKVTRPSVRGKEDGWIRVPLGHDIVEGVLEIKGIRNEQFGEDGIRQLLAWVQHGIVERDVKYKPIFIGNNMIETEPSSRPIPFTANFSKKAEIADIAAVQTEDLYRALLLNEKSALDRTRFWQAILSTRGVVDMTYLRAEIPTLTTPVQ